MPECLLLVCLDLSLREVRPSRAESEVESSFVEGAGDRERGDVSCI